MENNTAFKSIGRYWWVPLVTGILYIILGIWAFMSPMAGVALLAYFFAAFMLVSGVFNIAGTWASGGMRHGWGWNLAVGLLEAIAGVWLLCLSPAVIATAFAYVVGIWIVAVAVLAFCEACMMTRFSVGGVIWLILLAALTGIVAVVFLSNPMAGGVVTWIWLGCALIGYGAYRIAAAFHLRRLYRSL